MASRIGTAILAFATAAAVQPLSAQEQKQDDALRLTLDSLAPSGTACRVTLIAENALGADVQKVAYEFVFFDRDSRVDLLTVLDLKDLPQGRTRVRQFDLPGLECPGTSRVLINDAKACEGAGLAVDACLERLETASNAGIPLEN
jgi:hypothetical protein